MSFRPLPLVVGQTFRVRKAFVSGSSFEANELLTFVRYQGYSRYDDTCDYEFRTATGEEKVWMVSRGMPEEQMHDFLAPADP